VTNNNGGGIFSFLPIASETDIFETHFATPQNYSIRQAAAAFGIDHSLPDTNEAFRKALLDPQQNQTSRIVELQSNRTENMKLHRSLQSDITSLVAASPEPL
jgi:2-succinyl-5-enolpyruvyl-6-hydroxy-3-cyclohexene-1-carboxylate synthase